jgi:hypothetical protein
MASQSDIDVAANPEFRAHAIAKINQIITLCGHLGSVIQQEIKILAERRPSDLKPLLETKNRLTEQYQAEMAAMREHPEMVKAAPPDDIERLKDATFLLHGILDQYRTSLTAAKTVTERLVKAIGDEVASRRQPMKSYGANAQYAPMVTPATQGAASIALNQVI